VLTDDFTPWNHREGHASSLDCWFRAANPQADDIGAPGLGANRRHRWTMTVRAMTA
jgi:hypothetical protein